jgi:DNA-binding CsgD family transcriptional regulator
VVLADASMAAFMAGRPAEAQSTAARALELSAEPAVAVSATLVAGLAAIHLGDLQTGLDAVCRLQAATTGALLSDQLAEYVAPVAVGLVWAGRFDEAARLTQRAIDALTRGGALGLLPNAYYAGAYVSCWRGDLDRALVLGTAGLQAADEVGNRLWLRLATGCLALVEAMRGDLLNCRRWAERTQRLDAALDVLQPKDTEDALGLAALCAGDPEEAFQQLSRAHRAGSDAPHVFGRPTSVDLVEACVRSGREIPPGILAALSGTEAGAGSYPVIAAQVWRCRGLIGAADPDDAFPAAIGLYAATGLPWQEARTRLSYGEVLRRTGHRVAAREQLRMALDLFMHTGSSAWADRAGTELAAAGAAVTPREPNRGTDLTPQELTVARAVAGGASNREVSGMLFLSPKTVEMHLTRIYRKLGLRSRTQLAVYFARSS